MIQFEHLLSTKRINVTIIKYMSTPVVTIFPKMPLSSNTTATLRQAVILELWLSKL